MLVPTEKHPFISDIQTEILLFLLLRRCSTRDKHKAENSHVELGKTANFTLPASVPNPKPGQGENALDCDFSFVGKEKIGAFIQRSGFPEGCPRNWLLFCLTQSADRAGV